MDTEKRYKQIEKEALAVTWASEKFADLIGKKYTLETNHKLLVPLLGSKDIDQLPARVQRCRMMLMPFTYEIKHMPGTDLSTADTLSRAPHNQASDTDLHVEQDVQEGWPDRQKVKCRKL